jgi:predicted ArsR family transcriptional regulator
VLSGLAETPQISAHAYRQVLAALEAEGLLSAAEATQDA